MGDISMAATRARTLHKPRPATATDVPTSTPTIPSTRPINPLSTYIPIQKQPRNKTTILLYLYTALFPPLSLSALLSAKPLAFVSRLGQMPEGLVKISQSLFESIMPLVKTQVDRYVN
jgi:hypothetical protein